MNPRYSEKLRVTNVYPVFKLIQLCEAALMQCGARRKKASKNVPKLQIK